MTRRVIARLDIKGPDLVKGVNLEGLRVLGDPAAFARHYYRTGIDELMYQDVVASLYARNSLETFVRQTARDIFVPLTVGGGLRSIDDVRRMLRAGADKVALNTAAIARPELIREAARVFGSSTIVVAIEAIRQPDGRHLASTESGRELTAWEAVAWARAAESLGAGEILVTSVDCEGTGRGFDLELTASVARAVSIPVIAHGGAGEPVHLEQALTTGGADAVAVASLLHYSALESLTPVGVSEGSGNREFLRRRESHARFHGHSVATLKACLQHASIDARAACAS